MKSLARSRLALRWTVCFGAFALAAPALAENAEKAAKDTASNAATVPQDARPAGVEGAGPPETVATGGPPAGVMGDSVFDDTWITLGVGAGLVPSYSGSNDYRVFPLPLVVGRVGGVGITPNGPGFNLDLLSQPPSDGPSEIAISFGPTFRVRNDRDGQIEDDVVALAGDLETAIELGVQGGVTFPAVLNRFDRLTLSTAVRWDVLGAHDGMLIEPGIAYFTPLGRDVATQILFSAGFVDDDFADYYYSVSPAQSAASGLTQFTAEGGLNSLGATAITTFDLDGNVLNGGFNIFAVGGYTRLVGDGADSPYTDERGSADQFIVGMGIGYTF